MKSTAEEQVALPVEDCEWVDDAVLSLSAVFSLCHAHDHAQIEFERQAQGALARKRLHWQAAAKESTKSLTDADSECDCDCEGESEGVEATKLAKPKACVLEDQRLDTAGLEVQLQSIQIY